MPLETGTYTIAEVTFIAPDVPPISRPLGLSQLSGGPSVAVVILPVGTEPPKWNIEKLSNGKFVLTIDNKIATPAGSIVQAADNTAPYEWTVFQGPGHPPPVGNDNYSFMTEGRMWANVREGDDAQGETPIILDTTGFTWHVVPA